MSEDIFSQTQQLCTCKGTKRENRIPHVAFPNHVFCKHVRDKCDEAVVVSSSHRVLLSDSKFDYTVSIDKKVWENQLKEEKQKLYYYLICSKVSDKKQKQKLFEDYLNHNVCFLSHNVCFLSHNVC